MVLAARQRILLITLVLGSLLPFPAVANSTGLTLRQSRQLYPAQKALEVGDPQQCTTIIHQYQQQYPDSTPHPFYALLGVCYHQLHDDRQAAHAFTKALLLHPGDSELSVNLATCHYLNGDYLQAGEQFTASYAMQQPPDPQHLYQAAIAFIQGNDYRRAATILRQLIDSTAPAQSTWQELLLSCHLQLKEWDKARTLLDHLLQQKPLHLPYWQWLAQLHLQQQHYAQATTALEVVIRLAPPTVQQLTELAELYRYLQIPLRAAALLRQATPQPDLEQTVKIVRLYVQGYDEQTAHNLIAVGLQRWPDQPQLVTLRNELWYENGDYQQLLAADHGQTASPRHTLLKGYAAWHLGHWQQAQTFFHQALAEPASRNQARNALQVLDLLADAQQQAQAY